MAIEKRNLEKWKFALGEEITCLDKGREVTVPHTWNVEADAEEYWGTGWYACSFVAEESWRDKRVRIFFHAVYHDACVYLNGREVGVHKNSGYTPFVIELTDNLHMGEDGKGKWKKRVHGSADLYGQPKPSYYTMRKEYSPLILEVEENVVKIKCRNDLPSYTVKGYLLKWKGQTLTIPDLKPGDGWSFEGTAMVNIDELEVYRPGGERVL